MSQRNISRCSSGSVKLGHGAKAHVPCSGWMVHRSTDVSMSSPVFSGWYTVMLISGHVLFYNKHLEMVI
uniref:Uncharacterized protein n=1 Tax=Oryza nivara TaxID=4536 RepID=A0A0E0IIU6_ORYNI